jgi:hypothetical protein
LIDVTPMPLYRIRNYFLRLIAVWVALAGLFASEHHGVVKSGGLPVPGATITATQDSKKVVTTTDDQGVYSFPDLVEGVWTIQVEMLGFAEVSRDIGVAPDAPSPQWDLKLLSAADLAAAMAPKPAPAAVAATTPAPSAPAAAGGTPAAPATAANTPAPAAPATSNAAPAANGRGATAQAANQAGRGGRNQAAGRGGTASTANNGRPTLLGAFQEVGVSQSAESSTFNQEGNISTEMNAQLSQSADQSFVVQGSQSSAMGMAGQADFGGGFGGRGGDFGGGGPGFEGGGIGGGFGGIPGMGGDATGAPGIGGGGRGGGGRGGDGGGGAGIGGGPGGGGRGGFGGPSLGGGRGGAGGRGMNQANARAFGNNRRNPRMMYTGSLNINEASSILNAQKYSVTGANLGKPYSNRTNTTGSVGGPLKIPKLLDGSKGQFQLNFTVSRSRNGQTGNPTNMPTALQRSGDFSQSVGVNGKPVVIYDPTTNAPFPGDKLTSISPIATALLKYYPSPNLPGATQNYQVATTPVTNTNNINARVNQTLSTKNRLTVNFAYQGSNNLNPNALAFLDPFTGNQIVDTGSGRGENAGVTWAHNISTRLINTVAYTFSRQRTLASPYFSGLTNVEAALGIQGVATDPLNWGPPSLSFTNFGGLTDQTASLSRTQTSSLTESLLWVHQKHSFTFGGAFRRQQYNNENNSNPRGRFAFNGSATSQFVNGKPVAGTGFDMADFLLGVPDTAAVQCSGGGATNLCNGSPSYYFRGSVWSLYATDDWRLSQRFSVSLGARWDYQTPVSELHNQIVNLAFAPNFTAYAPVQPGQTDPFTGQTVSGGLVNPDKNNISPRFGFAWKPFAKKSTVVRGGYGIAYNTSAYYNMASRLSQQPPQARSLNLSILNNLQALQTGSLTMANAFSYSVNTLTANTYAIDPNYKVGYGQTWNLSVQQNLPLSFQTTLSYTGIKGTHLDRQFQPWTQPPGSTPSPYPSGYTYETYGANSSYNAANVQMTRRFSSGVTASATYTFQKYLGEGSPAQNWLDFRSERGVMTGPHSLSIRAQYSTGQGRLGAGLLTGWRGHLVKDWTIMTNVTLSSGAPLTPTCSGNACLAVGSNNLNSRPEYTGATLAAPLTTPGLFFNTAAFIAPLPGVWGDAARGSIPGPLGYALNGQASRVFRFGERRSADLQLTANNVLNTVIINGWNTSVGSNSYGQAINAANMRTVTASLRFRF